jgi:hypothetical protein
LRLLVRWLICESGWVVKVIVGVERLQYPILDGIVVSYSIARGGWRLGNRLVRPFASYRVSPGGLVVGSGR